MGRLARAVAAAGVAAAAVLSPLAAAAAPLGDPTATPTATPTDHRGVAPIGVEVASVAPQVATRSTDVTLTLSVTNRGRTPLTGLTATATVGGQRFTERGQVGGWLSGSLPAGATLAQVTTPVPAPPLAAGETRSVAVVLPRSVWRMARPFAAVPVAVTVAAPGERATTARTVVPWLSATPEYVPLKLAWVVPLTAPSDARLFSSAGADTLASWKAAVGPGSVVRRRLAAARSTPVTWFVDPTLVDGARYVAGASATTPVAPAPAGKAPTAAPTAPAAPDATGVAARVQQVTALTADLTQALDVLPPTQDVWSLPPGDPDTAQLVGRSTTTALRDRLYPRSRTPLDDALHRTVPRATAWPADGVWSALRDTGWRHATGGYPLTTALVSSSSLGSAVGYTPDATHRSPAGTGLLAYDEELSDIAGGTATGATSSPGETVQRFLAESLVLLGEREGTSRGVVVALPRSATVPPETLEALWTAVGSAPWLRTTTLPALTAELPTAPVTELRPPAEPLEPAPAVDDQAVARVGASLATAAGIGRLLPPERAPYAATWSDAAAQLVSARWRGGQAQWVALDRAVSSTLSSSTAGIQVAPATVNFLADAGKVALTVTNRLPYPVSGVRLRLTPGNSKLRVDAQPPPLSINANSRRTVYVDVSALGSGEVPVVASLTAPDGTRLGTASTVTLNVWPPGEWLIYVIGGFFALVLAAGVVRTLTRKPTRAVRDDLA